MNTGVYWIEGPWQGRLAVSPRPRGGEWLEDEIRAWSQLGIDVVVSLLAQDEIKELYLNEEAELCRTRNISYISFPIEDRNVPISRSEAVNLICELHLLLSKGHCIVIHCRGGIGRSGLLAGSLLVVSGIEPEIAIRRVSDARGFSVPETAEQIRWVKDFGDAAPTLTR